MKLLFSNYCCEIKNNFASPALQNHCRLAETATRSRKINLDFIFGKKSRKVAQRPEIFWMHRQPLRDCNRNLKSKLKSQLDIDWKMIKCKKNSAGECNQRTLTMRESNTVGLISCLTGLDSTKQVKLLLIQRNQSSWILTK